MSNSIGQIRETTSSKGEHEIQWTIKDVLSYTTADSPYNSPSFDVSGTRWCLQIYPNGGTSNDSVGWMGLYLLIEEASSFPQGACYTFGLKKADGTVEEIEACNFTWLFEKRGCGFGMPKLLQRLELMRSKFELAPSDALTLTCTLRVYKDLHSSANTNMLSHDLLDLFTSKNNCDATLKVNQEEFPVHKCILSARSSVFAAMFEADMKEKRTGVVDIVDCDPVAFKDFLAYVYTGKAENLSTNALNLYRIANKYDVKDLKSDCLISIMGNLSVENVMDAAVLGHQFSKSEIINKTRSFFNDNFCEIVLTSPWKSLLKSNYNLANELLIDMASKMKSKK